MATIDAHNNERLRKPMLVEIRFSLEESAPVEEMGPQGSYKLYDSTLSTDNFPLRILADLQGGGFKLDGTAQLYDSTVTASRENGKLGLRGNVGETLTLRIETMTFIKALTVDSQGASKIRYNASFLRTEDVSPVASREIFNVDNNLVVLTFFPENERTRVVVDVALIGAHFEINNSNMISAQLELRSSFDEINPKWEESTLDVSWMNSADISDLLVNIPKDTPVTYRAGYSDKTSEFDEDMSNTRRFYIDDEVTQTDGIISLKAKDASHWLDGVTLPEGDLYTWPKARKTQLDTNRTLGEFEDSLVAAINATGAGGYAGVTHYKLTNSQRLWKAANYHVRPSGSFKNFLTSLMIYAGRSSDLQFSYVDAGIPRLTFRTDGTNNRSATRSQLSRFEYDASPFIKTINSSDEVHGFNATLVITPIRRSYDENEIDSGVIYEVDTKTLNEFSISAVRPAGSTTTTMSEIISWSPSGVVCKAKATGVAVTTFQPLIEYDGRQTVFVNVEGEVITDDPPLWGSAIFIDPSNSANRYNPFNAYNRDNYYNKRIKFSWKGDPRWQPRDPITIDLEDGYVLLGKIETISMKHEAGGTLAEVTIVKEGIQAKT